MNVEVIYDGEDGRVYHIREDVPGVARAGDYLKILPNGKPFIDHELTPDECDRILGEGRHRLQLVR